MYVQGSRTNDDSSTFEQSCRGTPFALGGAVADTSPQATCSFAFFFMGISHLTCSLLGNFFFPGNVNCSKCSVSLSFRSDVSGIIFLNGASQ
ncbi:hypothetical protein CEXT_753991 [Caerostris extrusa]|uniref:Uncharacterized protein n=1 Tax=Caerostris extrusa TaxID=172846 RepID=A0AAV4Q136_CAEEX|nr:hypothetical protein CEXT_753991 [Caerostris extrusa]